MSLKLLDYVRIPLRRLRRRLMEERLSVKAYSSTRNRLSGDRPCVSFIASFTSYGSRLQQAHKTVETLLSQSVQPERLILWISEKIPESEIPQALKRQRKRGLEIRGVKDIGPYTKIIPSLRSFPDTPVLTVDDDTFYPSNLFQRLFDACKDRPEHVHCYRAHYMRVCDEGWPEPYCDWEIRTQTENGPSSLIFPTGVGGVIYPPGILHKRVLDEDLFGELCPTADDVWLKAMALLNDTKACRLPGAQHELPLARQSQEMGLKQSNVAGGRNDTQIRKVFEYFNLNKKLKVSRNYS